MKTALILGITGGFGGSVAAELAANGWNIRAIMRDPSKLPNCSYKTDAIVGDAGNIEDVRQVAAGADLIVYGVNAPYPKWENTVVPMLDVTATVAEQGKLTVLFPGNIYTLDPKDGSRFKNGLDGEFDEGAPINPPTRKGELRAEMEERLKTAASRGARIIIIRTGDYIGLGARGSWMPHLIKTNKSGYTLQAASDPELVHTWSYLPDVARVAVKLVANVDDYENFNVFHFKGYRVNFFDIAEAIKSATGRPVKIKSFPWAILKLLQVFSPMMRSLVEMQYLWKSEINLSDKKLQSYLGQPLTYTALAEALLEAGVLDHPADHQQGELKQA